MHRAGLGEFIEWLADASRDGKGWDETLSGRPETEAGASPHPLWHKPGLLFLDEATGALDVQAQGRLPPGDQGQLPGHHRDQRHARGRKPPKSAEGVDFYDSVLTIADGMAVKSPLRDRRPAEVPELTRILTRPQRKPASSRCRRASGRGRTSSPDWMVLAGPACSAFEIPSSVGVNTAFRGRICHASEGVWS